MPGGEEGLPRAGRPAMLPLFHPQGTMEGPEAGGGGDRMKDKRQPIPNQSTRAGRLEKDEYKVFWTPPSAWQSHAFACDPMLALHRKTWLLSSSSVAGRVRRELDLVPTSACFLWSFFHF